MLVLQGEVWVTCFVLTFQQFCQTVPKFGYTEKLPEVAVKGTLDLCVMFATLLCGFVAILKCVTQRKQQTPDTAKEQGTKKVTKET